MADEHRTAQDAIEDAYTAIRGRLDYPRRDTTFPYLAAVEALDRLAALAAGEQTLRQALENVWADLNDETTLHHDHERLLMIRATVASALAADAPAPEEACWCSEDGITPKRGHSDDHLLYLSAPVPEETLDDVRAALARNDAERKQLEDRWDALAFATRTPAPKETQRDPQFEHDYRMASTPDE